MSRTLLTRTIETPVGPMIAGSISGEGEVRLLCLLEFVDRPALPRSMDDLERPFDTTARPDDPAQPCPVLDAAQLELGQYFAGERKHFDLPLSTPGTDFQNRVWSELLRIPCGETISYGELADRVGSPGAQRAVGAANGRNRIAIIIPCHRVIESTGALRGYGGGLKRKQFLLDHERRMTGNAAGTLFEGIVANTV
ncbi:MAG: methylated-DNA--[protein]-cysteine S-methyltransferase [Phycisphaeraceae bacterium]|nr:methylated-DNA--[protein]-cysteine S-methyltransferase [Phycisphaerales bacterium]MCB9842223.1 methylated-DNA--[protein]-cysteine S-methyltransferase [Phycisphaeraceae bacterium]